MNLNPDCFSNLTLADIVKSLSSGVSFENKMGLRLMRHPVERNIEIATETEAGYAGHGLFPMTQQGLEDAILAGFEWLEDTEASLMGFQVYSYGETYNCMSDEVLTLDQALTELTEAEINEPDLEWSLLPVYAGGATLAAMTSQSACA